MIEALCKLVGSIVEKHEGSRLITRTLRDENGAFLEESPYLQRYYIFRSKKLTVYLHRFFISDRDDPHDHPWDSISIPLYPGFTEETFAFKGKKMALPPKGETHWRKQLGWYARKAEDSHIIKIDPKFSGRTWSMFIHFERRRDWGFWNITAPVSSVKCLPKSVVMISNTRQADAAVQAGLEYRGDNLFYNPMPVSLLINGEHGDVRWLQFKVYGEKVLNQNIESGVVPGGEADFKIVGGPLFPKVVYGRKET